MFSEIQANTFSSRFSVKMKSENNQTKHSLTFVCVEMYQFKKILKFSQYFGEVKNFKFLAASALLLKTDERNVSLLQ